LNTRLFPLIKRKKAPSKTAFQNGQNQKSGEFYPAPSRIPRTACCGDEWLNIAFLRGAIPRQEGAGFIYSLSLSLDFALQNISHLVWFLTLIPDQGSSLSIL